MNTSKGEYRPFCQCKPGYYGDGINCEEKFTLVIELCRGEDGKVIPGALRGAQNTSMLMNFWMTSEERGNYQQNLDYNLPDTKVGFQKTTSQDNPIDMIDFLFYPEKNCGGNFSKCEQYMVNYSSEVGNLLHSFFNAKKAFLP